MKKESKESKVELDRKEHLEDLAIVVHLAHRVLLVSVFFSQTSEINRASRSRYLLNPL